MANDAPWTYTYSPNTVPRDAVRLLIGDTNKCQPLLYDGEIDYLLTAYANSPMGAAIRACEMIWAKYSGMADETVGSVSISFSQKAIGIKALQAMLTRRVAISTATPYAGGISNSDKQVAEQDTDRVRPDFTKKMLQNDRYPSDSAPYYGNPNGDIFNAGG